MLAVLEPKGKRGKDQSLRRWREGWIPTEVVRGVPAISGGRGLGFLHFPGKQEGGKGTYLWGENIRKT